MATNQTRDHLLSDHLAQREARQLARLREDMTKIVGWSALGAMSVIAATYVPALTASDFQQQRDALHTVFFYYNLVVFTLCQWPRVLIWSGEGLTIQSMQIGMFIGNALMVWLSVIRFRGLLPLRDIERLDLWKAAQARVLAPVRAIPYPQVALWFLQATIAGVIGNFAWMLLTGQR